MVAMESKSFDVLDWMEQFWPLHVGYLLPTVAAIANRHLPRGLVKHLRS